MMKQITNILSYLPFISGLRSCSNEQGKFPAGHYYSPIPSKTDVIDNLKKKNATPKILDVNLHKDDQLSLLKEFSHYYKDLPFTATSNKDCRYYFNQNWFGHTDAIILYSFLRHFDPKRIVEIGSGFSSAVMLDTLELFPNNNLSVTFIEPFPERLQEIMRGDDHTKVTVLEKMVQEVDMQVFESLEPGDLLFIDSSHVMKFGSDLYRIFFEILPVLPVGVHVHFHDIFYPFEYPSEWLKEGRYWNECYLLRSFLAYNESWVITLFNDYVNHEFKDLIKNQMPLCRKNYGGGIYIRKEKN